MILAEACTVEARTRACDQGVLAITWRQNVLGCAFYDPTSRTIYIMDDARDVRQPDLVDLSTSPSTTLLPNKA